jgi:hypothetical protein
MPGHPRRTSSQVRLSVLLTLLHRDRCQQNRRHAIRGGMFLEQADVRFARFVDRVGHRKRCFESDRLELRELDVRRSLSTSIQLS